MFFSWLGRANGGSKTVFVEQIPLGVVVYNLAANYGHASFSTKTKLSSLREDVDLVPAGTVFGLVKRENTRV